MSIYISHLLFCLSLYTPRLYFALFFYLVKVRNIQKVFIIHFSQLQFTFLSSITGYSQFVAASFNISTSCLDNPESLFCSSEFGVFHFIPPFQWSQGEIENPEKIKFPEGKLLPGGINHLLQPPLVSPVRILLC